MEIDLHIANYHIKNSIKNDLQVIQKKSKGYLPALLALFFFSVSWLGIKLSFIAHNKEFQVAFVTLLVLATLFFAVLGVLILLASYFLLQVNEFRRDEMTYLGFFGNKKSIPRKTVLAIQVNQERTMEKEKLNDVVMRVALLTDGKGNEYPIASIFKGNSISDVVNSNKPENIAQIEAEANQIAGVIASHWNLKIQHKITITKFE